MPFFIVESSMGFAGDDEFDVIEADTTEEASEIKYEDLCQNISAYALQNFETQEEADNWMEEGKHC